MKDEFHGMGGSYVIDPKTHTRKLVERTDSPQPETPPPAVEVKPAAKE